MEVSWNMTYGQWSGLLKDFPHAISITEKAYRPEVAEWVAEMGDRCVAVTGAHVSLVFVRFKHADDLMLFKLRWIG